MGTYNRISSRVFKIIFGDYIILLMVPVQSAIRRFPNSLSSMEDSMAGHVDVNGVC
jgi:hypothetical protein